jgi:hypothetical protein
MGAINREWHQAHRMPERATEDQRGQWHSEHAHACGCRKPSEKEAALIEAWRSRHER